MYEFKIKPFKKKNSADKINKASQWLQFPHEGVIFMGDANNEIQRDY